MDTAKASDLWLPALSVLLLGFAGFAAWHFFGASSQGVLGARGEETVALPGDPIDAPTADATTPAPDLSAPPAFTGQAGAPPAQDFKDAPPLDQNLPARYGDALALSFDTLSGFYYEDPNTRDEALVDIGPKFGPANAIPENIQAYNGKRIAIKGFMSPTRVEDGKTSRFVLVKNRMFCCYGRVPRMNEWIYVEMAEGKSAAYFNDRPVTVVGRLAVGEKRKEGMVLSIYRLEADLFEGPLDL